MVEIFHITEIDNIEQVINHIYVSLKDYQRKDDHLRFKIKYSKDWIELKTMYIYACSN